jgi:hypothetical protein
MVFFNGRPDPVAVAQPGLAQQPCNLNKAEQARLINKAARDVFATLNTINNHSAYSVDSKGTLSGYDSRNIILKVWFAFINLIDGGKTERETVNKITKTLQFVDGLKREIPMSPISSADPSVNSASLEDSTLGFSYQNGLSPREIVSYKSIAQKLITKYPAGRYPELNAVANRLINKSICPF